jgi:hypothetical protein
MAQVFTIVWAGELGALRQFLADKPGRFSVNSEGHGRHLRIDITQRLEGEDRSRRLRAGIGDTLEFDDDGLICVEHATVAPVEPADPFEQDGLFAVDVPECAVVPDPLEGLSADRRRTLRRLETLAAGFHPITKLALHPQAASFEDRSAPGRRCGNCKFRGGLNHHNKNWPKCWNPGSLGADEVDVLGYPYITNGAGTDVPAWMPACREHSYGDPKLSDDAARYVPEAVSVA